MKATVKNNEVINRIDEEIIANVEYIANYEVEDVTEGATRDDAMKNAELIEMAIAGEYENVLASLKLAEPFAEWKEAQSFMIECGKNGRKVANENESFIVKNCMKEIEESYKDALHADCGFTVNVNAQRAVTYLAKMMNYVINGIF